MNRTTFSNIIFSFLLIGLVVSHSGHMPVNGRVASDFGNKQESLYAVCMHYVLNYSSGERNTFIPQFIIKKSFGWSSGYLIPESSSKVSFSLMPSMSSLRKISQISILKIICVLRL